MHVAEWHPRPSLLLPEGLRLHILTFLPASDSARCAVLAKDWLHSVARIANPKRRSHDHLSILGWLSSTHIPRDVARMPGDIMELLAAVWELGAAFDLMPFEGIVRNWLEMADPHEDDVISVNEYGIANVTEFGVVGFRSEAKPRKSNPHPDYIVVYIMGDHSGHLLGGGYYAGTGRYHKILHIHGGFPFRPIVTRSESKTHRMATVEAIEALFLAGLDRRRKLYDDGGEPASDDDLTLGALRSRGAIPPRLRRIRDVTPPSLTSDALLNPSPTASGATLLSRGLNFFWDTRLAQRGRRNGEKTVRQGNWSSPAVAGVLVAGAMGLAAYLVDRGLRRGLFR
mmetsp:Transcript_35582/g.65928  ORF Transcript_35582/g.65928 Transcript_35582/m.65928 type:complete len:341 (-) Transcript_35582:104-1126(-)